MSRIYCAWQDLLANYVHGCTDHWLAQCERCLVSKGDYNEPKTVQGSLVANQPLELLCIDFTKADVAKGGQREYSCSHRCLLQV